MKIRILGIRKDLRIENMGVKLLTKKKLLREELLLKEDKCVRCGSEENLTIDHIVPYVFLYDYLGYKMKDSYADEWNLQILCKTCNKKKTNKLEFADPLFRKNFLRYLEMIPLSTPTSQEVM